VGGVDLVIMIIEGVVELLQANRLFGTLLPLAYMCGISRSLGECKAGLAGFELTISSTNTTTKVKPTALGCVGLEG